MAGEKRQPGPSLKATLFEEFYRFNFFRAVQIVEQLFPAEKPLGEALSPASEPVRFTVKPGFGFPPSDICRLLPPEGEGPAHKSARMEIAFMGLIGPSGVLPHWYTSLALERLSAKDGAFTSFLDMFHHRLISLFYLAWKRNHFPAHYHEGADDRYSWYLLSLMGLGTRGLAERTGFPLESLIFCGGHLSKQTPSVAAIEATVGHCLGVKATVDQFIERAVRIEPADRTCIGAANSRLGLDTVCGEYVFEAQTKFRVNLGPLSFERFVRFLPSGDMHRPVFSLVRYMAGAEYEFDVRAILKRDEAPSCVLGDETPGASRLGWTTWVKARDVVLGKDPFVDFEAPVLH